MLVKVVIIQTKMTSKGQVTTYLLVDGKGQHFKAPLFHWVKDKDGMWNGNETIAVLTVGGIFLIETVVKKAMVQAKDFTDLEQPVDLDLLYSDLSVRHL